MKATLIHYSKVVSINGAIQEIVIWELPIKTTDQPHGIKYRLHFGFADGTCLLRYDNAKHKGDHKHLRNREEPYAFTTVSQLLKDFLADVDKVKEGMG
jgi:hypothetical protein